jgi:hypothetical protein
MENSTGMSKTVGRIASLLAGLGVLAFFIGIFGGPREFAFVGLAMLVASFVGYFIEERGVRKRTT